MRCIICEELSFHVVCKNCQKEIIPTFNKREIEKDFFVYSFFAYNDIAPLLHTKHQPCGVYVYKLLSQIAFGKFFDNFNLKANVVPIDDRIKGGYSHTAVLANAIKSKTIKPLFGSLRARNKISYSGKSLSFRKQNPRNFKCKIKPCENIILMDDLVTTGTTLLEAKKVLKKMDLEPLFALTLANAKVK